MGNTTQYAGRRRTIRAIGGLAVAGMVASVAGLLTFATMAGVGLLAAGLLTAGIAGLSWLAYAQTAGDGFARAHAWMEQASVPRPDSYGNAPGSDNAI
jgi:hypothetical protein